MAPIPPAVSFVLVAVVGSMGIKAALPQHYAETSLTQILTYVLAVETVAYFTYYVFIYPYFVSPLRNLPTVKGGYPLIGFAFSILERPRGEIFRKWIRDIPNNGLIHFRGLMNQDRLLVTNVQALSEILVTKAYDFQKPAPVRNFLREVLGDGLIIVEGDDHVFLRKNIMPSFTFRHIKDLYPIFWQKSITMTQAIGRQVAKNPQKAIEINHWANLVTMDIIGLAAMGHDFKCMEESGVHPVVAVYEELLEPSTENQIYFASRIFGPSELIKKSPWGANKRLMKIISSLSGLALNLVHDKKAQLSDKAANPEKKSNRDILTLLIESKQFTDNQLADQLLTFLAAGHETTSSSFTWTAYLLAKHTDIQDALREEIRQHVLSQADESTSAPDLASILESSPLLNGVCNEASRLYPTVPLTVRRSVKETTLVGQVIPRDTEILLVPWATNRDPELWGPNAEEFDPYRWIDTDPKTGKQRPNNSGGASSNYAFLTFLHGPRSCIGQGFAKAELRCIVSAFVGSFEISLADPNEKIVPHGVVTTKPENGMHLILKPLKDAALLSEKY